MFLEFYKLREQPFSDTPDPRYVYLGRTHREALASLFYGIGAGRGFLALIAEPGMGKTTLLFHLLELLRSSARTAFLFQTQCDSRELLRYLLADLEIDTRGKDLAWMHERLKEVLIGEARAGKQFVVFIDEAQNLSDSALETVRLLSNFETPRSKLMQIVLAGQPQLADKLERPELRQLCQRISILSRLSPLTREETSLYIDHRLQTAGHKAGHLFTPAALVLIAAWSQGIPRKINNLCFSALTLGYALGRKEIDCLLIQEAANDLEVRPSVPEQDDSAHLRKLTTMQGSMKDPVNVLDLVAPTAEATPQSTVPPKDSRPEQGSRRIILVAAVIVFLVVGAAGVFSLHLTSAQSPATAWTNPVRVASPLSKATSTVRPTSDHTEIVVTSQPTSQAALARKPAGPYKNLILAPPTATLRSAARIRPDEPPDLTGVESDTSVDSILGVLPPSSNTLPKSPLISEETAPARVGGRVEEPRLLYGVRPNYPPAAKRIGLEGVVVIDAVIDATGKVTNMKVVSGPVLLQDAVLDSVRKWNYAPGYLDDKPVSVEMLITIEFRLH
jgi:TonB family protein